MIAIFKFMEVLFYERSKVVDFFFHMSILFSSLQDVLMQDSRLYLIFEFLSMDLKKYLDSIPPGQFMDSSLVKVRSLFNFVSIYPLTKCISTYLT